MVCKDTPLLKAEEVAACGMRGKQVCIDAGFKEDFFNPSTDRIAGRSIMRFSGLNKQVIWARMSYVFSFVEIIE